MWFRVVFKILKSPYIEAFTETFKGPDEDSNNDQPEKYDHERCNVFERIVRNMNHHADTEQYQNHGA